MRNKALIVALTRTSERVTALITVVRAGLPDREMTPADAIALCRDREDWRGEGPRRHVKRVIFDPLPKPDPAHILGYRTQYSTSVWITYSDRQLRNVTSISGELRAA